MAFDVLEAAVRAATAVAWQRSQAGVDQEVNFVGVDQDDPDLERGQIMLDRVHEVIGMRLRDPTSMDQPMRQQRPTARTATPTTSVL